MFHAQPPHRRQWQRHMLGRDRQEVHRASTPLELFFDLIFVVAIAFNAAGLHHGIVENHVGSAVLSYCMQFAVIWWAWMGFTWFASAFDTDDVPYRILVFVQMAGALVIAAGIPAAFESFDFRAVTVGYLIMRVGLVSLWLRAGRANPDLRSATSRYAKGLAFCQLLWIGLLFAPKPWVLPLFFCFMVLEIAVPIWAEMRVKTPWHPEHINERFSLFTIIVLGESILATVNSIKNSVVADGLNFTGLSVICAALVIVFSLWWLYFDKPEAEVDPHNMLTGFFWAYGHYFIFASAAAVGVGLSVAVEHVSGSANISRGMAQWAMALPVAAFLLSVWLVHLGRMKQSPARWLFPVTAALVLASTTLPNAPLTVIATALVVAGLLAALLYRHYDASALGHPH